MALICCITPRSSQKVKAHMQCPARGLKVVLSAQILCKDPRTVGAGGAAELELAKQLAEFGKKETGLDQYSIAKFAESLEVSN